MEEDGEWVFLPPGDDTVEDVELWKEGARLESTEPRRESDGAVGRWIIAWMLEAKKPNRLSAFAGGKTAVGEVTHCLVALALAVLGGGQ